MDAASKVKTFILETFLFDRNAQLSEDTLFLENGVLDSTGVLELVSFIEEQFAVAVEDDEIVPENLNSLENIATYLRSKGVNNA